MKVLNTKTETATPKANGKQAYKAKFEEAMALVEELKNQLVTQTTTVQRTKKARKAQVEPDGGFADQIVLYEDCYQERKIGQVINFRTQNESSGVFNTPAETVEDNDKALSKSMLRLFGGRFHRGDADSRSKGTSGYDEPHWYMAVEDIDGNGKGWNKFVEHIS